MYQHFIPAVMHALIWAYHRAGIINWEKGLTRPGTSIVDYRFCTVRVELIRFHGGERVTLQPMPLQLKSQK